MDTTYNYSRHLPGEESRKKAIALASLTGLLMFFGYGLEIMLG